ncbi:RNA polymerase II transcription factor B subunit 1 [Serendipita sp. 405]|nr:RNA polymerase II transcription factor B subunit 1 [Serendipita sp. 405]
MNLYANKSGVKPPKLKIVANDVDYNFIFAGEEPSCFVNRDAFRDQVKLLIRESMTQPSVPVTSGEATPEVSTPIAMDVETPQELGQTSVASATPIPAIDPAKELAARTYRLKKKILMRDTELAALHNAVVINGKMSEGDFWASRQHLVEEAAAIEGQKRGKSSRLIDPKPDVSTTGDIKISITPQLQMDIFEEWPIVKRAYDENVSNNMTKEEFWKRYFESQLYHNNRASVRSSATQHRVKEDPIFDKYLDPLDNEIEPRKSRQDSVSRLVDLVSTREDHGQTGNTLDQMQTMQSTTGEYLRQFWFHITPPPEGVPRLPVEERAQKIGAMRDRLLVIQKRIPELVSQAAMHRWDSTAVQEAFAPTMAAIERAVGLVGGPS